MALLLLLFSWDLKGPPNTTIIVTLSPRSTHGSNCQTRVISLPLGCGETSLFQGHSPLTISRTESLSAVNYGLCEAKMIFTNGDGPTFLNTPMGSNFLSTLTGSTNTLLQVGEFAPPPPTSHPVQGFPPPPPETEAIPPATLTTRHFPAAQHQHMAAAEDDGAGPLMNPQANMPGPSSMARKGKQKKA
ncbi:uncharacterized protein EI90DRAFT_3013021 [Cantharellus anzutake]|uniref:uncharacterized protein n=1 Tax=Cantharellus anzutake TaxID=1750568 RepID=UPI00190428F1|nr:uncharacterized protein EI90DRAFT_3013021 [Cantharellus anzutake]KAF8338895.1 hypothetical protein EI90DRAFT_3013021 [Cantharellus anzutake]